MDRAGPVALALGVVLLVAGLPVAEAGEANAIDGRRALVRACRKAERRGRRALHAVRVAPGDWRFGRYLPDENFVPVDTRRNLRVLEGSVEVFPSDLELIGFVGSAARADKLRAAARGGATLRIGFFLGYDNRHRTACLIRPALAVSTVRMDVAFVELVGPDGRVLAREDTERLRAWLDDRERDGVPGSGPRGAFGAAMMSSASGIAPEAWQRALATAHEGPLGRALGRCHAEGIDRGAARRGQVVLRLAVAAETGEVREAAVELSSIGDAVEAKCIARAVTAHVRLPPAPAPGRGNVDVSVPVRLAAD